MCAFMGTVRFALLVFVPKIFIDVKYLICIIGYYRVGGYQFGFSIINLWLLQKVFGAF